MKKKSVIIVALILIVGIALTIVFVNLFKERDTKDLSISLNSIVENGYLNEENENYKTINNYFDDMSTRLDTQYTQNEAKQAKNYRDFYSGSIIVANFVNKELIFAQYTDVYKANRKKIEKNLSKANDLAADLATQIKESQKVVGDSNFWTINTWKNFSADIEKMFECTSSAIKKLCDVYTSCVNSQIYNNDLTEVLLEHTKGLITLIDEKQTEDGQAGHGYLKFVNFYLTSKTSILNYTYSQTLQNRVKSLKEKGESSEYYSQFVGLKLFEGVN